MEWTKVKDQMPQTSIVGPKVLLYRIPNEYQDSNAITIYDTVMVRHCDPEETWWMPLPKRPKTDEKSVEMNEQTTNKEHDMKTMDKNMIRAMVREILLEADQKILLQDEDETVMDYEDVRDIPSISNAITYGYLQGDLPDQLTDEDISAITAAYDSGDREEFEDVVWRIRKRLEGDHGDAVATEDRFDDGDDEPF